MIGYCKYTVLSVTNGSARVVAEDGSRSSLQVPEDHANELIDELNLQLNMLIMFYVAYSNTY